MGYYICHPRLSWSIMNSCLQKMILGWCSWFLQLFFLQFDSNAVKNTNLATIGPELNYGAAYQREEKKREKNIPESKRQTNQWILNLNINRILMDSLLLIHGTHQGQTVFAAVIPQSCDLKSPWQYKGWIGTGRPGRSNGEENLLYGKQWEAKENILFFLYHKGHMRGRGKQRMIHQSGIAARFPMAEEEGSNGAIRRTSEKSLSISSNRKILHKWLKEKSQFWRTKEQLEKDSLIKRYKICIFNKKNQ